MAAVAGGLLLLATSASAAAPDFLLQIPEESIAPGIGAGELTGPGAVTGDPVSGHVYVAERNNARIGEFTAWGQFVKAWGWDVAPNGAPGDTASDELEVCTSVCQAGDRGDGLGQLNEPWGVTFDGEGNLHIFESQILVAEVKARVQKFDTDGNFLLTYGGAVNKTTGENVCTKADSEASEVCGAGVDGSADGFFSGRGFSNHIAYNPIAGSVFVGDKDRIQEFDTDGNFVGDIDFEGELAAADGRDVGALAADPVTGDLYFSLDFSTPNTEPIYRVSSSGSLVDEEFASTAAAPYPGSLATDADGRLYVAIDRYTDNSSGTVDSPGEVIGFEADGTPIAGMELGDEFATPPAGIPAITGLGTNVLGPGSGEPGDLYVAYVQFAQAAYLNAYGPAPILFGDPPLRPPTIGAQYGVSAGTSEALVRAQVNPRFWDDTTFFVEYGAEPCSAGGCEAQSAETLLTANSVNKALTTSSVLLDGLEPGTTYHFRFVAESTGGGLVFGADPDGDGPLEPDEGNGLEGSFRTFAMPTDPPACPANEDVRIGPSARLPDCRGYEMVSPLEKGGGDVTLRGEVDSPEDISQVSLSGESFAYSAKRAFGELESAPVVSQYLADRDPDTGWGSDPLAPQRTRLVLSLESAAGNEFEGFSEDLCRAWLIQTFEPVLADGAIAGYPNLYRRENCSGASPYEALSRPEAPLVKPTNRPADKFIMHFLGASEDGSHGIFLANGKLTAQGAALGGTEPQLYEHVAGASSARLVCILTSGNPSTQPCGAGVLAGKASGAGSHVQGAISDDGQRIFWTSFVLGSPLEPLNGETGRIFVRVGGETTKAISQSVSAEDARFWGASEDGSTAIFEVLEGPLADNLYEFDVDAAIADASEPATLIAGEVVGMLGISDDVSRLYLASREDLDGGGSAAAGDINLYLREGGDFTFIAALPNADLSSSPRAIHPLSMFRLARLTPDGRYAAFMSAAPLTGYDNTDALTGQRDSEVFLYDSVQGELRCVSCNPTGIRPTGQAAVAARIPVGERPTYASRILSGDGQRLFFESYEALVPGDTNAKRDVYQWEAPGKGSCDESDPTFGEASGGCVDLISSGQSTTHSHFLDASAAGEDVFIATLSSLVPQDYGLIDVYDARVGGGFPPPPVEPECEGQACQSPPPPPTVPTPATSTSGGGASQSRPCPKGKRRVVRKGKPRCVKPRKGKKRKRTEKKGADR